MNVEDSEAYMWFKLKTLLKRQIKRERKFQKRLAYLKLLIDKYGAYESLLNNLNAALRASDFHVVALKDILSDLHSPGFFKGEVRLDEVDGAWPLRYNGIRLKPVKGEVEDE